jgi:hypothetical protein
MNKYSLPKGEAPTGATIAAAMPRSGRRRKATVFRHGNLIADHDRFANSPRENQLQHPPQHVKHCGECLLVSYWILPLAQAFFSCHRNAANRPTLSKRVWSQLLGNAARQIDGRARAFRLIKGVTPGKIRK